MAAIPNSISLIGTIAPPDDTDPFPVHEDIWGKGGYRSVVDISARDAITELRQKVGMLVYVISDDTVYKCTVVGTPGTYVEYASGGASSLDDLSDVTITAPNDGDVLVYDTGTTLWTHQAAGGAGPHTHGAEDILPGTFSTGNFTFDGNVLLGANNLYAENATLDNGLYLNDSDAYNESTIHFGLASTKYFLHNQSEEEFRLTDNLNVTSGSYKMMIESKVYDPTGIIITGDTIGKPSGSTIVDGRADWHTVGDHFGFQPDWTGYTWNEGDLGTGYFCGMWDHTLYFDPIEKYWHIIGIRTIANAGNGGTKHATKDRVTFLHAKSKTMGGLSGSTSDSEWVECPLIESLSGNHDQTLTFDGKIVNSIWAPHLIERDGCYYLFYTGVELNAGGNTGIQRIFVAKSYDLDDWSGAEVIFLFDASDSTWADLALDDTLTASSCRDPFVIWDEENTRWQMFVTMQESPPSANTQVLGIATGSTLTSGWSVTTTRISGISNQISERPYESPHVFEDPDSNYWLTYTSDGSGVGYHTEFASGTTLFADGSEWIRVPAMDTEYSTDNYSWAGEFVRNPFNSDIYNATYVYYYDNWSPIEFDMAITFTGGTIEWISYDELSERVTVTTTLISGSPYQKTNLSDIVRGHALESSIHMTPDELRRELNSFYSKVLHDHDDRYFTETEANENFANVDNATNPPTSGQMLQYDGPGSIFEPLDPSDLDLDMGGII